MACFRYTMTSKRNVDLTKAKTSSRWVGSGEQWVGSGERWVGSGERWVGFGERWVGFGERWVGFGERWVESDKCAAGRMRDLLTTLLVQLASWV